MCKAPASKIGRVAHREWNMENLPHRIEGRNERETPVVPARRGKEPLICPVGLSSTSFYGRPGSLCFHHQGVDGPELTFLCCRLNVADLIPQEAAVHCC